MAVVEAETRVFLEVRRRLQSALLILGEPDEGGMNLDISVTPTSLLMRSPDGCTEIRLPAGVRLAPSSCGGLQYISGDGLHLRLRAQAESSPQPISGFNQSLQAQECCSFYCQSCGEVTIKDRKLLRVLPLPSENWSALVGEWCCHPDPFANKPLHPRENDCFVGDSFFLVNSRSDLEQEPKANTKVICKRCKVMLGETVSSETTKFYMTEVIVQPSEGSFPNIPRSQFVQSVIARCLVELCTARSTFRFTIQGQDGKVYILLWVLNSDSLVMEPLSSSGCIRKFPLLEDSLEADSGSAWNAIKVLYQPCIKSRNKELASSWEGDISVHPLTLPSTTCLELLLILSRNNASLPLSLRQMNSFQVAFLKM
ncbi:E3 ubiquitin-protein ligase E3D isoform X1 [Rattus norvegicus]|uniref:E3 ubiquitin-protein ligase E3D n=1 Tax=Rattus norvegicus TaxID=10116 RepID=A0ABK0M3C9_RAT|nr:E3 ubiquitin-protein ligase E3D isoform X1 [Rattus norvegicus]|eukprot:XP_006243541.1 PREDICTED: E3 ubiquitin-protein ligase E3D isoform X1 [Rattus norvegicus]